ncbi:hypothetical protein O3S80_14865 [Streptomyces sp. Lzd4kr]|nr:hypothetical protein [Streptomyces sp. Lzd4kr]
MVSLPPPLAAEILVDNAWQAVSARTATTVTVARGASSEGSTTQPGRCGVTLDNRDRSKSPRNPNSSLFGKIGRNTRFRLGVDAGTVGLYVPGAGRATTPDAAALDILGDIDIRIDARLDNWGREDFLELAAKQEFSTDERSWRLVQLGATRQVELVWFTDGTAASGTAVQSTVALPAVPGDRIALRVTLDVDNGASGWTLTWYTADTIDGPWTQLGEQVTGAGVTSIYNSDAPLDVGDVAGMVLDIPQGRFYGLEVYDGIGGTLVASPDFTAQDAGTTSFTDSAGRLWTVEDGAEISNRHRRFAGEIPAWPPSRDLSGQDISTQLAPAGILRRLSQGSKPLQSTLRRRIPSFSPVAYWPLEEGRSATSVSSPIDGVAAFTPTGFDFAADDTLPGSSPLPTVGDPASFTALVVPATAGEWQIELVYFLEAMPGTESTLFEVRANGTARRVRVRVATNLVRIQGFDVDDNELFNGFTTSPQFNGAWNRLQIRAVPDGGNVDYSVRWIIIGGSGFSHTETIAGSAGYVTQVRSTFENLEGLRFGHLAVFDNQTDTPFNQADRGFDSETASARMVRLCQEEGIPFTLSDEAAATPQMGPQRVDTVLKLLQDAADVDRGFLLEQRGAIGLAYRARTTLYNQSPRLTLEFTEGVIADFKATDDDKLTENDVTVQRTDGSESRAVLEIGALSIQDPPDGVGTGYDVQHTLNLETDAQTGPMANWLLHLGTFDGMRYPQLTLDLANPRIQEIIDDVLAADVGDLIRLTGMPDEYGPDDVDLIIQGYSEEIGEDTWRVTFHCLPGQPYRVGVVDDSERGRLDANPDGSTLALATDTDATQILVHTPARSDSRPPAPWITSAGPAPSYPAEFPYDIRFGGETARVTANVPAAWDTFTRSETDQWGTSDSGFTWVHNSGADSDRSVNGSAGVITLAANPDTVRFQRIIASIADCEVLCRMSVDQIATGASMVPGILLRYTDTSNFYRARVHFGTSGSMFASITRDFTTVGSTPSLPYSYSAGQWFWLRARITGQRIMLRVWPDGQLEPGAWHKDETISTSTIASGQVGLTGSAFAGSTNVNPQERYDDFQVITPQLMTVTRSLNGVAKAHAAGTGIRLAQPAPVAL